MPVNYQIVPKYQFPHVETHINDNTEISQSYAAGGGNNSALLCVFTSPKGRDNQLITINNGLSQFMEEFGLGPFSQFGQPLLNAYAAAAAASISNAALHCIRVMPEDAGYSNATVIAKYKVDGTSKKMSLFFVVKTSAEALTDLSELGDSVTVDPTPGEDGYTSVKLFAIAYRGRGTYGKNVRFRLTSDKTSDKENNYKNYELAVYRNESTLQQVEDFSVVTVEDAVYSGASIYAEDVINDRVSGSALLRMAMFATGFKSIYDAYKTAHPTTVYTINDFDPLLGIDKYTRAAILDLTIIPASEATPGTGETAVDLSAATGIALLGGSDGTIAVGATGRDTALNTLYLNAFKGLIDETIASKNRFPSTLILDANFDVQTKLAIASLITKRGDCMAMLDFGTGITTKAAVATYFETNFASLINSRLITFEPYAMKVRDPYSQKTITVTSTYWLSSAYINHIYQWNGMHRPLAGNRFGEITGFITDSVYPVFDEDLDYELLEECAEKNLNVAKFNQNQQVVRSMQNTAQSKTTALTEQSNMLILLDIKRKAERICAQNEYDFSEVSDIARFNASIANITSAYADSQVRSITASFNKNDWEAARGIIHLYVEMVNKDLVKTTILEIDVNRE